MKILTGMLLGVLAVLNSNCSGGHEKLPEDISELTLVLHPGFVSTENVGSATLSLHLQMKELSLSVKRGEDQCDHSAVLSADEAQQVDVLLGEVGYKEPDPGMAIICDGGEVLLSADDLDIYISGPDCGGRDYFVPAGGECELLQYLDSLIPELSGSDRCDMYREALFHSGSCS